jgi:hypothetical protein
MWIACTIGHAYSSTLLIWFGHANFKHHCCCCCRGDGFATDADLVRRFNVEDPNPFFSELMGKPYRKQVVLSPHFYGQSITNSTLTEWQLWEALTKSWGQHMVGARCIMGMPKVVSWPHTACCLFCCNSAQLWEALTKSWGQHMVGALHA